MIVVLVASDPEIKYLEKRISVEKRNFNKGALFLEGLLAGKKVLVVKSGIGPKKARSAAKQILNRCVPAVVISMGAAGAIDPVLKTGECVVVNEVMHISKDLKKEENRFSTDKVYSQKAHNCLKDFYQVAEGSCLTTGDFIHLRKVKEDLFTAYNAQVIDMESAALAEVFCKEKIPFIDIRIISDTADRDITDVNLLYKIKREAGVYGTAQFFIKNPAEIIKVLKFRVSIRRVSIKIGRAAEILANSI